MLNQEKIIEQLEDIPSLPITVSKILDVTKDPNVSAAELNRVISLDPILTVKVLRLVNSAYYSVSPKITSIVRAIILLGINTIRNLALTTAVIPIVGKKAKRKWKAFKVEDYWKHSIGTGVTAKLIARNTGVDKAQLDQYFIGGLLHDIGKVILTLSYPDEYRTVIVKANKEKRSLFDVETEILGINHVGAGLILAEKWDLPPDTNEVISYHHDPSQCESEYKHLVYSVATADAFCILNDIGYSGNSVIELNPEWLSVLGINEDDLIQWEKSIKDEINKASIFMNIQ